MCKWQTWCQLPQCCGWQASPGCFWIRGLVSHSAIQLYSTYSSVLEPPPKARKSILEWTTLHTPKLLTPVGLLPQTLTWPQKSLSFFFFFFLLTVPQWGWLSSVEKQSMAKEVRREGDQRQATPFFPPWTDKPQNGQEGPQQGYSHPSSLLELIAWCFCPQAPSVYSKNSSFGWHHSHHACWIYFYGLWVSPSTFILTKYHY